MGLLASLVPDYSEMYCTRVWPVGGGGIFDTRFHRFKPLGYIYIYICCLEIIETVIEV